MKLVRWGRKTIDEIFVSPVFDAMRDHVFKQIYNYESFVISELLVI